MREKMIIALIMAITLLSFAFCKPQAAKAAISDTERIAALENQIKDLQNQQQQLAEQNLRLFELIQKLHGLEIKTGEQGTNTKTEQASIPAPAVAQSKETAPASAESRQEYTQGWLARILDVPNEYKITDIPHPLEVVNFKAIKSEYRVYEYLDLVDGAFRVNNPLWIAEGFIMAEEAGDYTFSIYSSGDNGSKPLKAIYVDDTQINAGSDGTLLGSASLEPGLHKVELRICGKADSRYPNFTFNLQVKRPSDKQMLPVSQVLLLPASNIGK